MNCVNCGVELFVIAEPLEYVFQNFPKVKLLLAAIPILMVAYVSYGV